CVIRMSLVEVKLRPLGPWRTGYAAGDRERADAVYHSDAVYSAVTLAMQQLGWLDEWLAATATASEPAVPFRSWFPCVGGPRLAPPPRSIWPPSGAAKLYLEAARFAPLELIGAKTIDESKWTVDAVSECVLPAGNSAPFAVRVRSSAAVDRFSGSSEVHHIAAL